MTHPNREDWKEKERAEFMKQPFVTGRFLDSGKADLSADYWISILSQTEQRIYKEMLEEMGEDEKIDEEKLLRIMPEKYWKKFGMNEERSRLREIITKKLNK